MKKRLSKGSIDTIIATSVSLFFFMFFLTQFLGYFYHIMIYLRINTVTTQLTEVSAVNGIYSQQLENYYKVKLDKLLGSDYTLTKKLYKFDPTTGSLTDISNKLSDLSTPAYLERGQILKIIVTQTKQKGLQKIIPDQIVVKVVQEQMVQNWGK